jgi:hypothetical protein
MRHTILTFILTFISVISSQAFDVYSDITNAIRSGEARSVSVYFNNTVDMTINNNEDVYSKIHAEQVLKEFFKKNTPKSFTLIHKGVSKEGSKYAIGNMAASNGTKYRVYLFIKQVGSKELIQEIRFEKQ